MTILFLKRYARKYDDPVLAMETVKEFLGKDRLERIDMIDKLKEQLRLFPDPTLGLSDLREFGYARGDMFPIRKNAAVELLGTGTITVYALSEDGRRDIVDSVAMLFTHRGMYGVLTGNITFSSGAAQRSFGSTSGRKAIQISTPVPLCHGELCPQQEKALEELGFELPHPDKPKSKYNRRKNVFDAACREMLFDITERYGLHLEREPSYGGRAYLEKQDYILMKQKEKLAVQEKQIEQRESELEELSIRIDDVETLIDEVAETAYDKAVETVTERVQEETHNADFELIRDYEKEIMRSNSLTDKGMTFAHQILSGLKKKFRGMTAAITEKLKGILKDPAVKAEQLKPIREKTKASVLDKLHRADAELKARRSDQPEGKKRNRGMEL